MAKLKVSLNTNRWGRRVRHSSYGSFTEQTHRLGDDWVEATVANWEAEVYMKLLDTGEILIRLDAGGSSFAIGATSIEQLMRDLHPKEVPVEIVRHRRSRRHKMRSPLHCTIAEEA